MKDRPRLIIDTDDDYTLRDFNGDVIVKRCRNLCASGAKIGGNLNASGAKISGNLNASDATIGRSLYAYGAKISGNLNASGATIDGDLDASRAEISGNLIVTGATIGCGLYSFGAKIGGDLYASRAKIGGDLYAYDAEISGVLIKPPTDAEVDRIREIIAIAETRPDEFSMREWHNGCGTAHCAYGWNQILCGEREDNSSALTFGEQTLPSIRHLIYTSEDVFLKNAKKILKRRAKGEIKSRGEADRPLWEKHAEQERQALIAALAERSNLDPDAPNAIVIKDAQDDLQLRNTQTALRNLYKAVQKSRSVNDPLGMATAMEEAGKWF